MSCFLGYVIKLRQKLTLSTESVGEGDGASIPNKDQVLNLIKTRRSVMPKDLCGEVLRWVQILFKWINLKEA